MTPDLPSEPSSFPRVGGEGAGLRSRGVSISRSVQSLFAKLEAAAGVTDPPGRACYGLRRQATDLAPEYEQDARVLNRLTGHVRSETREQVYQDRVSDAIRARAAVARQSMRRRMHEVAAAA